MLVQRNAHIRASPWTNLLFTAIVLFGMLLLRFICQMKAILRPWAIYSGVWYVQHWKNHVNSHQRSLSETTNRSAKQHIHSLMLGLKNSGFWYSCQRDIAVGVLNFQEQIFGGLSVSCGIHTHASTDSSRKIYTLGKDHLLWTFHCLFCTRKIITWPPICN